MALAASGWSIKQGALGKRYRFENRHAHRLQFTLYDYKLNVDKSMLILRANPMASLELIGLLSIFAVIAWLAWKSM